MSGPWLGRELPILGGWLKANEKPLAVVCKATMRSRFYYPYISNTKPEQMEMAFMPSLASARGVARALVARAMLKLGADNIRGARADLLATHRLAGFLAGETHLIERLVGVAIKNVAWPAEKALVASAKLTAEQAREHLAELEALPAWPDAREAVDVGMRWYALDCVMACARAGSLKTIFEAWDTKPASSATLSCEGPEPDWNQLLRAVNYWHTRMAEVVGEPVAARRLTAGAALHQEVQAWRSPREDPLVAFPTGGPVEPKELTGRVGYLMVTRMPGIRGLVRLTGYWERVVQQDALIRVALALAVHKAEQGAYPASLAALAPGYIKAVPADRFSGEPLRYRREDGGYVLYSVGVDLDDDGGEERWDDDGDIVVRVE